MQMSIIEVFICRRLHMNTSMILICIWLICRLCTALHTKCCGAVQVVSTVRYIQEEKERKRILHGCHVHPTSGHLSLKKILYRLRERYMWHGYVKDVSKMVCFFVHKGYFVYSIIIIMIFNI